MNIVFLDEYSLGGIDLSRIKQLGNYTGYEKTTPGEIAERCIDADIVITNKVPLRAEAIKVLPQLKLICIAATGMNNVDLEAAAERGIEVRNAVGYSTHAVTETTIGAAIALLRQSIYYDRYVKSGEYAASDAPFHFGRPLHQLYGKRWGIIGLGAIGHKVAEVAAALGCQIAYTSTSGRTAGTLPRHAARRTAPLVGHRVDPRSLERPHARPRRSPGIGPDETFGPIDQRSPRWHRR